MGQGSAATRPPEFNHEVAIRPGSIAAGLLVASLGYVSMFLVNAAVALVMAFVFAITSKGTAAERKGALS